MDGYVGLFRCLLEKPIWKNSTPEQKSILVTLLLMVNHHEKEWEWKGEKFIAKPGQRVTSLDKIAETAGKGITMQNVRTALNRFEKLGFLTNESTKSGRLITIVNWELYQTELMKGNKDTNIESTNDQQRGNKGLTPNKKDNNDNNDKKDIIILTAHEEEFITVLKTIENYPVDLQKDKELFNTLAERYPTLDLIQAVKDWAVYKEDNPLKQKCNARSQINTSFKKYAEWGKCLKPQQKKNIDNVTTLEYPRKRNIKFA